MPITTSYATMQAPIERIRVVNDNRGNCNEFMVRANISGGPERSLHLEFVEGARGLYMTPDTARKFAADLVAFADQVEAGR